jgi:hypothetical protein
VLATSMPAPTSEAATIRGVRRGIGRHRVRR